MLMTLSLLLLQGQLTALASSSADSRLPQDPVVHGEDCFLRVDGPPGAQSYLTRHAWMALCGDQDGDGIFDAPGGVDALGYWPLPGHSAPLPSDFVFSTPTSFGGFLDGDVLRLRDGQGVDLVVGEADFLAALQPASGGFDLDAVAFQAPNQLWFSVADRLTGTTVGDVEDGDVLTYDLGTGVVSRVWTEADIQAMVDFAEGGSTTAVGDLLSLSFLPSTGEMVFTIQSPSSKDAAVYGVGGGGRLIPGWEEADWDFQVSTELDALAFVPGGLLAPPILDMDVPFYSPGDQVGFRLRHGVPGSIARGYRAVRTAFDLRPGLGMGFLFLDPQDPWLIAQVSHGNTHPQLVDASGSAAFTWDVPALPPGMNQLDLYFQVLDGLGGGWSNPVVLRIQ